MAKGLISIICFGNESHFQGSYQVGVTTTTIVDYIYRHREIFTTLVDYIYRHREIFTTVVDYIYRHREIFTIVVDYIYRHREIFWPHYV